MPLLFYRSILFAFLGDESLNKAQRAVGTVMILRADAKRKFRSRFYDEIDWEKIAKLSGYSAKKAKEAFGELVGLGWFSETTRETDNKTSYRIEPSKYDSAVERQQAHNLAMSEKNVAREPISNQGAAA